MGFIYGLLSRMFRVARLLKTLTIHFLEGRRSLMWFDFLHFHSNEDSSATSGYKQGDLSFENCSIENSV